MENENKLAGAIRVVILMPVFCDWGPAAMVCQMIDRQLATLEGVQARVLLVDDGSPDPLNGWVPFEFLHTTKISALLLRRNVGHQRAIATGLCLIQDEIECDAIIVMDADGEDRPEDIRRLMDEWKRSPESVVFAERGRRFESLVFRMGYRCYRLLHRLLTGVSVRAGNFSLLPRAALERLVSMSELWNHYAGAIYKSKLRHTRISADRGSRLGGRSRMNLVDLVVHGISGIATFYDTAATRILVSSIFCLVALAVGIATVFGIRFATNLAIPGWATLTTGLLVLLAIQFASLSFTLLFLLVATRFNATFIPAKDYRVFVKGVQALWEPPR